MQQSMKVILLGAVGVGKSSLVKRIISDQFCQNVPTTLGATYFQKMYQDTRGKTTRLQFWDTAGQQKFRSIARIYYRGATVAIFVYDVTNRQSFDGLKVWMKDIETYGPQNVIIVIVGNKDDLLQQQVNSSQGQAFANSQNALFKLTSAKQNKGINDLLDSIIVQVQKNSRLSTKNNKKKIKNTPEKDKNKKQRCC